MKNKQKFIDCHVHLMNLYDKNGRNCFDYFDDVQKYSGAEAINICSILAGYDGDQVYDPRENILAALYKLHNPTAYAYGGLGYPELPIKKEIAGMDLRTQYEELLEIGFDGIKMLETRTTTLVMLQKMIDDPYFEGFFEAAEKDGTHIICHVASPHDYWYPAKKDGYTTPPYPTVDEIYESMYKVLERHPKLNITFAHFFFLAHNPKELERLFARYENVGLDLTPGWEMFVEFDKDIPYYKAFMEKYADRIMHGTDVSFPPPCNIDYQFELSKTVYDIVTKDGEGYNVWGYRAKGLNLSDEACKKILYGNFIKQNPQPKKINVQALQRYAEKYKHLIVDDGEKEEILKLVAEAKV